MGRHGPDGVSLRQISLEAGSSNHFAVQYYFNDKQGLLRAIFERRIPSLEARRGVLLDELFKQGRQNETRALLEVLLRPIAEEKDAEGHRSYAMFLLGARLFSDLTLLWGDNVTLAPLTRHLASLIRASVGAPPESPFFERERAATTVFLAAIADCERRSSVDPAFRGSEAQHLDDAIAFGAAGLMAPY